MSGPEWLGADDWPRLLRPVVGRFGGDWIWRGSLLALGYPASWIRDYSEAREIISFVASKEGQMQLNATKTDSIDDLDSGGYPLPGKYHVVLENVEEKEKSIVCKFVVLAGTTPGQEDKKITEFFPTSENAQPRLIRLAMSLGLLKPGEEKDVDFQKGVGGFLIVEAAENEYEKDGQKKKNVRVPWMGMWPLGHKDVGDVPINQEELNAPTEPPKPEQPPQDGPAGAGAGDDGWGDL